MSSFCPLEKRLLCLKRYSNKYNNLLTTNSEHRWTTSNYFCLFQSICFWRKEVLNLGRALENVCGGRFVCKHRIRRAWCVCTNSCLDGLWDLAFDYLIIKDFCSRTDNLLRQLAWIKPVDAALSFTTKSDLCGGFRIRMGASYPTSCRLFKSKLTMTDVLTACEMILEFAGTRHRAEPLASPLSHAKCLNTPESLENQDFIGDHLMPWV